MPKKLTKAKLSEINQIANSAPPHKIIKGKDYLYFSLAPTQESIRLKEVCKKPNITCYAVKNFKNCIIGYTVFLGKAPEVMNLHEFGVAIFYSKIPKVYARKAPQNLKKAKLQYRKPSITFSDAKFRVLSFDSVDYFVGVRWKSNNPTE